MPKIKVGNRTDKPFSTIKYIEKDVTDGERGMWNVLADKDDIGKISREFVVNESDNGTRKYYHEIVAFHPKDKNACTPDLMESFADGYIKKNYADHKIYWGVHRDKEHPHIHFCVSATDLSGRKTHHNAQFNQQKDLWVQTFAKENSLHRFPEMDVKKQKKEHRTHEQEGIEKHRKKKSDKGHVLEAIGQAILNRKIKTKDDFKRVLLEHNIEISKRETGVVHNNRTYRFRTIGLDQSLYKEDKFYTESNKIESSIYDTPIERTKELENEKSKEKKLDKPFRSKPDLGIFFD